MSRYHPAFQKWLDENPDTLRQGTAANKAADRAFREAIAHGDDVYGTIHRLNEAVGNTMTLTPLQREHATKVSGIDEVTYAKELAKLKKLKSQGMYGGEP